MRMVVLAALGLVLATPSIRAQEQPPASWAAKLFADDSGKIPSGYDFGAVPKGAMLQHRFPIKNIYAVPLTITCDVSCACVSVTPKRPQTLVLQPKETGTIDITLDTMRFDGQKKMVYVYVQNPQYWSSTTLVISAVRRDDIELAPAEAMFGAVALGQQTARDLVIRYRGNQPGWKITGVVAGQTAPFNLDYQEVNRRIGLIEYRVVMNQKPDAPAGTYKDEIKLATTDPNSVVVVPYDMRVVAPLTVAPGDTVRLPPVKIGTPAERKLFISAGRPFKILGVDGLADGVTATFGSATIPTQVLTIQVNPTQPGPVQKTLTVRTDLGGATATVKVEATAVP